MIPGWMEVMNRTIYGFCVVTALLLANGAFATGTLRCGGHLVDQGMTKDDVMQHCGSPTVRKEGDNYWFYDRGSSTLVTRLFFVGDKVERLTVSRPSLEDVFIQKTGHRFWSDGPQAGGE